MPGIFISYRRDDSAGYAGRLRESLVERFGESYVFRDVDTLRPGQDFERAIQERVDACNVFLALIGQEWLEAKDRDGRRRLDQPDDYVRREIAAALGRPELVVIPVLTEGVTMPAAEELPDELRAFARRHAVSLRDESWQQDVERLAAALTPALRTADAQAAKAARGKVGRMTPALWIAFIAMASIIGVMGVLRATAGAGGDATVDEGAPAARDGDGGSRSGENRAGLSGRAGDAVGRAMRIDVPRVSEIVLQEQVYTVLWASVTPRGPLKRLRLRLRFVNEGRFNANFWTRSFLLVVGDAVLEPLDGPERLVPGATVVHDAITFDVPAASERVTLRVMSNDEMAELPLDLTPIGYEEAADTADPGDALSRAVGTELPVPAQDTLVDDAITITLTGARLRRFVNRVRLAFAIRFQNGNRFPEPVTNEAFRLEAGGEVLAPASDVSTTVRPGGVRYFDVFFEVPPQTRQVTLRVRLGDRAPVERMIDLGLGPQRDP